VRNSSRILVTLAIAVALFLLVVRYFPLRG
jgi:hypothetical protein